MLSGCKFKTCFCAATGSHTLRSSYVCYSFHLEEQLCVKSKISLPATGQSKQRACSSGQKNKSTKATTSCGLKAEMHMDMSQGS